MKIIVHSLIGDGALRGSLGVADYSYSFVRRFFAEALRSFAEVIDVTDPASEVDPIYDRARADGEPCLFLSFAPPQKTVPGLRCPVVPVFAWEFSTIPNEVWNNDTRNDWRTVFASSHAAIALSSYTVGIVKAAMGADFPIVAIPAPVFERFRQGTRRLVSDCALLQITGTVLDTDAVAAFRAAPVWPPDPVAPLLTPGPLPAPMLPAPPPVVLPDIVVVVAPEPDVAAIRINWRRRLQITRHLGLEWYRLAVRDLLPRPVRAANALAGRTMHRSYRRLRQRHVVAMQVAELPPYLVQATLPDNGTPARMTTIASDAVNGSMPGPDPARMPDALASEQDQAAASAAIAVAPPPTAPVIPPVQVALQGVVFVSMFSPYDGRKNWNDIVTAFCWAMRDVSDATLVLKIIAFDRSYEPVLRQLLGELAPLRCRVVVLHGFLEEPDYRALIDAASFYVNASHCEGLCLPMLEFMSAGTPAIAPGHTAFEDYVTAANAFVIGSGIENTVWPADERDLFRTTRYRIDWHALMLGYREAYRVAKQEPERYRAMSRDARETMKGFCGMQPVTEALRRFLGGPADIGPADTGPADSGPADIGQADVGPSDTGLERAA